MEVVVRKLDMLIAEFSKFKKIIRESLLSIDKEIEDLKCLAKNLTDRLTYLENKVVDDEIKSRECNIILSRDGIPGPTSK